MRRVRLAYNRVLLGDRLSGTEILQSQSLVVGRWSSAKPVNVDRLAND